MQLVDEQLVKNWEQLRLIAYKPTPNDVWTIGWGHTKDVTEGMTITADQAEQFFREDVSGAENAVNTLVKVKLNQNQYDALVDFVFNLGYGNFAHSTLLRKLNAGDYQGAADEFPKWDHQAGKVLAGLTRRRADERAKFLEADSAGPAVAMAEGPDPLKILAKSKEIVAGSGASLVGVSSIVGSLSSNAQVALVVGLSVALIAFGGFIIWNRLMARKAGQR